MTKPSNSRPPLHAVAVSYHVSPAQLLGRLQALASRCGRRLRGVAVSNNPAHAITPTSADMEVVRGSNANLDFSGYFEGLDRLTATHPDSSASNVLFVNDSLLTKHADGTILSRVVRMDALVQRLQVPAIAGKRDPYRSICLSNPWSRDAGYVTSFCFLLNARALPLLRRLPKDAARDGVFATAPVTDAAWGISMPPLMRETIRAHVAYEGSPYLWPSPAADDDELARKKASCVYFEHRLSGVIGIEGAVIPINSGPRSSAAVATGELLARAGRIIGVGRT